MSSYCYGQPGTLPDEILLYPFPDAVKIVIMNTPIEIIEASRFRDHIHRGPGVSIPEEIEWDLSVGMKYMFHQPLRTQLIEDAWLDFVRRFRWKTKFTFEGDNATYDPDYDVRPPSKKKPPVLPFYIEMALKKGRAFVHQEIARIPPEQAENPLRPLGPKLSTIRSFLTDNDYVITPTDKNLGIAVSQRTWIISKSLECISNPDEYRRLTDVDAKRILDGKCNEMLLLSQMAEDIDWKYGSVSEYLRSKITPPGEAHHLPKFYGIPKIHKEPVKFRPILPCHSAIQNPAAKFVSKMLKPIVNEAPTIIRGTKDLAIKFSQLELRRNRRKYIVTGDVVAYYPNIPLRKCLDRVYDMYMEHYWNIPPKDDDSLDRKEQAIFKRCLEVGNTQLLTQFDGHTYEQLKGLAMGVADSPDLANLYGWYCERRDRVQQTVDIAFYGRYIDDCIAIVYAESEEEAVNYVRAVVHIDDCEITWDAGLYQPFLDMMVYIDTNGSLQHLPYRKARSHQERIPWISSHPLDVKRGTFLGEMSRLATLSSKFEHYQEAIDGLTALYMKRGYPERLVLYWRKENLTKRWESRLRFEAVERPDVLVLKTYYNTAWDYFHARKLGETITDYMRMWLDVAERRAYSIEYPPVPRDYTDDVSHARKSLDLFDAGGEPISVPDIRDIGLSDRALITSRKRTQNLADIASQWKRIVLEKMDEREASGDAIRPEPPAEMPKEVVLPALPDPDAMFRHRSGRLIDLQDEDIGPRRRSPSPAYGWRH